MFGAPKSNKKAGPAKILVVDDEPDCLSIIQCRLEWSKYEVITSANGADGIRIAEEEKPDIILLDNNMPVMNGLEMLERMRKNPVLRETPVIMVTALCESSDIEAASAHGISDYVTKPIDFTRLLEKISNLLEEEDSKLIRK